MKDANQEKTVRQVEDESLNKFTSDGKSAEHCPQDGNAEPKNNQYATMTRRIGNTTYLVKVYLSENATETFEEKVLRLVRNDRSLNSDVK